MTASRRLLRRPSVGKGMVALLSLMALTGCTQPLSPGPSEVSVPKASATAAPIPGSGTLDRFDPAFAAAAEVVWGRTLTDLWLPQASSVVAGLDGTTASAGSVYLTIPARYIPVRTLISARNTADDFDDYTQIDVPETAASTSVVTEDDPSTPPLDSDSASAQAAGTVIEATRGPVQYTLTLTPDPDQEDLTLLLVRWETAAPLQ